MHLYWPHLYATVKEGRFLEKYENFWKDVCEQVTIILSTYTVGGFRTVATVAQKTSRIVTARTDKF